MFAGVLVKMNYYSMYCEVIDHQPAPISSQILYIVTVRPLCACHFKDFLASAELLFGVSFEKNETVLSVVVRRDVNEH